MAEPEGESPALPSTEHDLEPDHGRLGSGKSTAAQMLFRMLERNEGTITVDNIDISTLPRNTVRERLVAIPQEPFFVSGSVRLNLDAHDVATDEQLREALRSVGLGHILEAPGGLEAQLNPDSLSHGQRQMFCLARATLGKRAIVVLDEATSRYVSLSLSLARQIPDQKVLSGGGATADPVHT